MRLRSLVSQDGATPSLVLPHKSLRPGARERGPGGGATVFDVKRGAMAFARE